MVNEGGGEERILEKGKSWSIVEQETGIYRKRRALASLLSSSSSSSSFLLSFYTVGCSSDLSLLALIPTPLGLTSSILTRYYRVRDCRNARMWGSKLGPHGNCFLINSTLIPHDTIDMMDA
ncbi:unnamed protein product [Linum trigynum]|uniref:Uncharacterized protein n=1 Tax=Linum trigynum TaxID=586398 RepID=A0AAV2GUN4_9ROSI